MQFNQKYDGNVCHDLSDPSPKFRFDTSNSLKEIAKKANSNMQ